MNIKKFLILSTLLASNAYAEESEWDKVRLEGLTPGKTYNIASGTGFFVGTNLVVTSKHVVKNCVNIAIRGAVKPAKAILVSDIEADDLALLSTEADAPRLPYIRMNYQEIQKGDMIFTIGYPLERGDSGIYILKSARVLKSYKNETSQFSEIEFTDSADNGESDSVEHGNSGGPLLDNNGNIIGVVKAKATYKNEETGEETYTGIGVGLDALISFLDKNNVYYLKNSTSDIYTNYSPDREAKHYVVNVHCVIKD